MFHVLFKELLGMSFLAGNRDSRTPPKFSVLFQVYEWSKKRKLSSSSLESAAKKRKVGRPKKHCLPSPMLPSTEMIVPKKAHSKSSLVGYLLGKPAAAAARGAAARPNPPHPRADLPSSDSAAADAILDSYKAKENLDKSVSSPEHGDTSPQHRPKIRPKLKAEVKVSCFLEILLLEMLVLVMATSMISFFRLRKHGKTTTCSIGPLNTPESNPIPYDP